MIRIFKLVTMNILKTNAMRILLVEDDPDYQDLIAMNLQAYFPNAVIDCAQGFTDVARRIEQGIYDHIFLDGSLKGWGLSKLFGPYGWELLPYITEHSHHSRVIGISNDPDYNQKMVERGAAGFIPKESLLSYQSSLVA